MIIGQGFLQRLKDLGQLSAMVGGGMVAAWKVNGNYLIVEIMTLW